MTVRILTKKRGKGDALPPLYSGVLAIAVAYLIWNHGLEHIGGPRTSAFSNLVPVVALITAALWLGDADYRVSVAVCFRRTGIRGPAVFRSGGTDRFFHAPNSHIAMRRD